MKELFYYLIFAIVLYFILTRVFENFYLEQENFDPSLVPVSSIVTLAKVAQKLVNGNGTLTNPGNLQIGASASAPGNLIVTGNSTVTGNSSVTGNSTVTGNLTIMSNTNARSVSVNGIGNGYSFTDRNNNNNRFEWYSTEDTAKLYYNQISSTNPPRTAKDIFKIDYQGNAIVPGNATINGVNIPTGNLNVKGTMELKDRNGRDSNQVMYNDDDVFGLWASTQNKRTFYVDNQGNMGNTGNFTSNGTITAGTSTSAQTIKTWGSVVSNSLTVGPGSIEFNGPVTAGASLSVGTNLTVNGSLSVTGDITSNLRVTGNITATGNITGNQLCIGSTCITENQLKILTGQTFVNVQNDNGANLTSSETVGGSTTTSHTKLGRGYTTIKYKFIPG